MNVERLPNTQALLGYFANIPSINFSKQESSSKGLVFQFPELERDAGARERGIQSNHRNFKARSSGDALRRSSKLDEREPNMPSGEYSLDVVLAAIERASQKLVYGETTTEQWERRLVFVDDTVARVDDYKAAGGEKGYYEIQRSDKVKWEPGFPINQSREVANDWFVNILLNALEGHDSSDGIMVRGNAGAGKSTIIKYLILNNFPEIKERDLVFSRFEFLKLWRRVKDNYPAGMEDELRKYVSQIHMRDLMLHQFCNLKDGHDFVVDKAPLKNGAGTRFDKAVAEFLNDSENIAESFEIAGKVAWKKKNLRKVVQALGNGDRKKFHRLIRSLRQDELDIAVFALAQGKRIVTIFDGIDAVQPEDILRPKARESSLWQCACEIMKRRNEVGRYRHRADAGGFDSDGNRSVLVVRHSTRAGLESLYCGPNSQDFEWAREVNNLREFGLEPVGTRAAALSAARAAISFIPEFADTSREEKWRLADLLLTPFLRALRVVTQRHSLTPREKDILIRFRKTKGDTGLNRSYNDEELNRLLLRFLEPENAGRVDCDEEIDALLNEFQRFLARPRSHDWDEVNFEGDEIIDLFNGNLRKLYVLQVITVHWTRNEMFQNKFFGKKEFMHSARRLLETLASDKDLEFLAWKGYRSVEFLLVGDLPWFENVIEFLPNKSADGPDRFLSIDKNKMHLGLLDNVLNYDRHDAARNLDDHMLLKKVRALQILTRPMTVKDFRDILSSHFGYSTRGEEVQEGIWLDLLFLTKCGLVTIRAGESSVRKGSENASIFETSRRGRLAIELLTNLTYVEHIFHQVLLPQPLVGTIKDKPRGTISSVDWAIQAVRNAFVLLTYLKMVEMNELNGQKVPERYRLYDEVRAGLMRSIRAMADPARGREDGHGHFSEEEQNKSLAQQIVEGGVAEIERLLAEWKEQSIVIN